MRKDKSRSVRVVGLTGGIGSGKSTAAAILADLGALVIDADKVGHTVYLPGTAGWDQVVETFGPGVVAVGGEIDRKALGAIVFADPGQLARLNGIVHPLIRQGVRELVERAAVGEPSRRIVVEAAVLIEAKWFDLVDEVWVVVAARDAVLDRVTASRGLARAAVQARIDAQLSDRERREVADVIIENDGTPAELRRSLERLWDERLSP